MFFNSHKKSGKEVGNFVKTTFFRPFVLGVEDNFDLSPLFFDNYIFGFIITAVGVSLDRYGAQKWNSTKRGEAIAEAMQIIDPNNILSSHYAQTSQDLQKLNNLTNNDNEFKRGINDATSIVGLIYGILNEDDPDPILQQAKNLKDKFDKEEGMSDNSFLVYVVSRMTIFKHIEENYIKNKI